MTKIKNILLWLFLVVSIFAIYLNFNQFKKNLENKDNNKQEEKIPKPNQYVNDYSGSLVKISNQYVPNNYQDLLNIFYNVINNGWEEFDFKCSKSYKTCIDDVAKISEDQELLSTINNLVHPYNSYKKIQLQYDETGEVKIMIEHLYTEKEIKKIDEEINRIIAETTTEDMDLYTKIKNIHDYIINNTKYDQEKSQNKSPYDSERMTGLLFENYAICSGYSDTEAVILTKLGVKNYKIVSDSHVWNAVYYNNKWLHLDLTWDDPVTTSGRDVLNYDYFLITDEELFSKDATKNDHEYNCDYYKDFK